jgi:hypothetical protein
MGRGEREGREAGRWDAVQGAKSGKYLPDRVQRESAESPASAYQVV